MPASRKKTVTQLAAEWQRMHDEINSRDVDDEKIDGPQMKRVYALQAQIVKATFKRKAEQIAGRAILAGGDSPVPMDWCHFKSNLYLRMQAFA